MACVGSTSHPQSRGIVVPKTYAKFLFNVNDPWDHGDRTALRKWNAALYQLKDLPYHPFHVRNMYRFTMPGQSQDLKALALIRWAVLVSDLVTRTARIRRGFRIKWTPRYRVELECVSPRAGVYCGNRCSDCVYIGPYPCSVRRFPPRT